MTLLHVHVKPLFNGKCVGYLYVSQYVYNTAYRNSPDWYADVYFRDIEFSGKVWNTLIYPLLRHKHEPVFPSSVCASMILLGIYICFTSLPNSTLWHSVIFTMVIRKPGLLSTIHVNRQVFLWEYSYTAVVPAKQVLGFKNCIGLKLPTKILEIIFFTCQPIKLKFMDHNNILIISSTTSILKNWLDHVTSKFNAYASIGIKLGNE